MDSYLYNYRSASWDYPQSEVDKVDQIILYLLGKVNPKFKTMNYKMTVADELFDRSIYHQKNFEFAKQPKVKRVLELAKQYKIQPVSTSWK